MIHYLLLHFDTVVQWAVCEPFSAFIDNGLDDQEGNDNSFYDDAGELWSPVTYRRGI